MTKPIKQHYVPKSYLKNFSVINNKNKSYVDIFIKDKNKIIQDVCIDTICYKKNIYTLNTEDEERKYNLEYFYANNIDSEFQTIYKFLIDKEKHHLTEKEKWQVLFVCFSFYFRTPHILNNYELWLENIVPLIENKSISISHDLIINKSLKIAKSRFHYNQLGKLSELVKFRLNCTINIISVTQNNDDLALITSDNPVIVNSIESSGFANPFNSDSIITMPLDTNHYIEIQPKKTAISDFKIRRFEVSEEHMFTLNSQTQSNSNKIIIGKGNTLSSHFDLQEEFENTPRGELAVEKAKLFVLKLSELKENINKYGWNDIKTLTLLRSLSLDKRFRNDTRIKDLIELSKKIKV